MERKKILTGILIVAVIIVWGIIILKVVKGGRPVETPPAGHFEKTSENVPKDSLLLDYRDPFLGEFVKAGQEKKPSLIVDKVARREPEQPPVPDFTFKGLIGNDTEQRAMILKNGGLHMLGLGETIGGFKVVGVSPEIVTVQNGKHRIEVKVR
ncbi:MAG: hypothetical protein IJ005_03600 [Bacteroidales bacterium]|nr:hypothetical protein [Bacteroidales bacterium]